MRIGFFMTLLSLFISFHIDLKPDNLLNFGKFIILWLLLLDINSKNQEK